MGKPPKDLFFIKKYELIKKYETKLVTRALRKHRGSVKDASRELNIGYTQLHTLMYRLNIKAEHFKNDAEL